MIIHGLFGSSDNWGTLGKKFSETNTVYLIDQRNHGHSNHDNIMNYDVMAEDLMELINEENIIDPILLGHSMGGKTAMRFTQKFPLVLAKLIVADIGVKKYSMHHNHIIEGLNSIDLNIVKSRGEATKILANYVKEFGIQQFLLKNLFWKEKGHLAWRMNLPVIVNNMSTILGEIPEEISDTSSLFLRGEKSNYILESDFEEVSDVFTNATFETIYNAGHWLHAENPNDFYSIVTEFIKT
jgi:esterase